MSIELLVESLIEAMHANTRALASVTQVLKSAPAEEPVNEAPRQAPAVTAGGPAIEAPAIIAGGTAAPIADQGALPGMPVPATVEAVKGATLAAIKTKGRDAVAAILGEFGLKRAGDAKADQYDAILGKLRA